MITTRVNQALVYVLALFIICLIGGGIAQRTKTNGAHGRSMTPMRTTAVLYATIVATTKRSLVIAIGTLSYVVAQLRRVYAHVESALAFDLIRQWTPEGQRRTR